MKALLSKDIDYRLIDVLFPALSLLSLLCFCLLFLALTWATWTSFRIPVWLNYIECITLYIAFEVVVVGITRYIYYTCVYTCPICGVPHFISASDYKVIMNVTAGKSIEIDFSFEYIPKHQDILSEEIIEAKKFENLH